MKITGIKTYVMESPGRDYVFVKVLTDEGIHGWGEGTLEMKQGTVVAAVRDVEGFVLGAGPDPDRVPLAADVPPGLLAARRRRPQRDQRRSSRRSGTSPARPTASRSTSSSAARSATTSPATPTAAIPSARSS